MNRACQAELTKNLITFAQSFSGGRMLRRLSMNCVYKASLRWKFGSKSRSWVSKAQACRSRRGHGTQSLLLGLPPVEQALTEGLTGGVFTTSRPGADIEQPAPAPIVERAQPGPAAHAAARFVWAWTQARIGHGLPPARECPQAGTGQQQGQGNARADARDSLQPGVVGAALGLGIFPEAFFKSATCWSRRASSASRAWVLTGSGQGE